MSCAERQRIFPLYICLDDKAENKFRSSDFCYNSGSHFSR